jgi:hypothetical protein
MCASDGLTTAQLLSDFKNPDTYNPIKEADYMIRSEVLARNILKIIVPEKLKADDFLHLAPEINTLIAQYGNIRLLIDASAFNGWENMTAFENHVGFIKDHQQNVERIAIIVAREWQHWLIGAIRILVHPEVKAYDQSHEKEALEWITG